MMDLVEAHLGTVQCYHVHLDSSFVLETVHALDLAETVEQQLPALVMCLLNVKMASVRTKELTVILLSTSSAHKSSHV